ncbi:MAG: bifunctional UDP-N-acetylglucosamine diphosphorylase/glucosamine-1-phosphate N-acetyltransferase GlmU [Bauldia sp.]
MSPQPASSPPLIVVLAAGEGTRMKSELPKVLHRVAGLPMLGHVLVAAALDQAHRAVVVGPGAAAVRAFVAGAAPEAAVFEQRERLGTAHAVLAAEPALAAHKGTVVVVYGDTPLLTAETLRRLLAETAGGAAVAVLGFRAADPTGYGRLIVEAGRLLAIREERDATAAERAVTLCNGGVMALAGGTALTLLRAIGNANAKREYYLTDAVEIANARGLTVRVIEGDATEVLGVNTRAELAVAERLWQERARARAMAGGATLIDPATVYFSHDTVIGRDVTIEPHVYFGPGVTVADGAELRAYSHIEGTRIGSGARIGPFARLRPGTEIGASAHIGNFVEVKNSTVASGAKANHLTYLGDASVGAGANVGAGTITCNYDGFGKYRTDIGAGAFIGSNSALVAPVSIGADAYVASGSVVTADVAPGALAVARARQVEKPGWVARFRALAGVGKKPS